MTMSNLSKCLRRCAAAAALAAAGAGAALAATEAARAPTGAVSNAPLKDKAGQDFPPAPAVRTGALAPPVRKALAQMTAALRKHQFPSAPLTVVAQSKDARLAWYLYDLSPFVPDRNAALALLAAFESVTGAALPRDAPSGMGDRLLAWNLPAPPGYREMKRDLFLLIEPRWKPFFDDERSAIDWRWIGWGGVLIDDRPDATQGAICPLGCIPALDQPKSTPAAQGSWYPDDAIVFGVVINGQARAYPKNMMEVHEMVNDTLGGRRIGMPYCTLCLSVQAYFTDQVPEQKPLLRTSGLLSRSNKFMYDLSTFSGFDTFTGKAISGPLHKAGVVLPQTTVVVSTWAAWRQAYPQTSILAEDGGIGRRYPLDPLRGRDAKGPIFPVGDVDPRLGVHEVVLGVTASDGTAIAFPRAAALLALKAGEKVSRAGVTLRADGGGLRAYVGDVEVPSHQAFWFAWSQFKAGTQLWERGR